MSNCLRVPSFGTPRRARAMLVFLVVLASGPPAAAQDRLFVGSREVGALGRFGDDLGPAPAWLPYPRFGGDRYVHLLGAGVVDIRTGATHLLGEGYPVAYDRARPHVFLARDGGIWQEDVRTSWAVLVLPVPLNGLSGCVHATSADMLLCAFARTDGQYDFVRTGPFGPVLVATALVADPYGPLNWVMPPDGSAVYFAHCARQWDQSPTGCIERDVARIDLTSGVLTATGRYGLFTSPGALLWDEANDRLFVQGQVIDVYARDLSVIGSAGIGGRCRQLAVSPHTGRLYLNVYDYYYSAAWMLLSAYDAPTFRLLEPARRRTVNGACGPVTVLTAPGAPRDVRAVVEGHAVHVAWTNIGAASHFVLEAGTAPGRTDLSILLGPDPRVSFTNVPPGTYYVRLRGGNEHGGGRPSREIAMTVR